MKLLRDCLSELNIKYNDETIENFGKYYDLLISWNERINLTTVTKKEDVIIKHFIDSIMMIKYTDVSGRSILDIGTGAGFPGIPIKIICPDCDMVLLDSLQKRIGFLDKVISELNLEDVQTVHGRAEDLARSSDYRGSFDIVTSRAVANLSTLSEYCLPFVNIDGYFISYKGINIKEEISDSENAIKKLGGRTERIEEFTLPMSDNERSLIFIRKTSDTPERFPRKAGTPLKKPL